MTLRQLSVFSVALSLVASTGCIPGVAWLPDSSGFVYTAGKDYQQLVLFDVIKRERHILVEDTKAPTFWPAVSPDGRQIAVARHSRTDNKSSHLELVFFDRSGKEQRRSKRFDWSKKSEQLERNPPDRPQLFWSPRGDKLIVHADMVTGIYDIKADTLRRIDNESLLLVFGGTPIRPDGSGFLVILEDKSDQRVPSSFRFVDWDGKMTTVAAPALLKDKQAIDKEKDLNKLAALLCPAIYQSRWNDTVAEVSWNVDQLRYDTAKRVALLDSFKPEKSSDGRLIKQKFVFADSKVEVRTVVLPGKKEDGLDMEKVRVELVKPGQPVQVLLEQAEMCVVAPAPNPQFVALRCLVEAPRKNENREHDERVLVVRSNGEITAHLHVAK
jgi:hypothetical protein